jgi:hypothetical protein
MLINEINNIKLEERIGETNAYLYYLNIRLRKKNYYKIGVTVDLKTRMFKLFNGDDTSIALLDYKILPVNHAYQCEEFILNKYKIFKIMSGLNILSSGNSEIFIRDVLNIQTNDKIFYTKEDKFNRIIRETIPGRL